MCAALGDSWNYCPQVEGDLGQKMSAAIEEAFKRGRKRVVVIGTDAPELQAKHLKEAFANLETADVVLGPAEDGGYYLIGMNQLHRALFSEISWSTEQVFTQTLQRIRDLRLRYRLLQRLSDIDYPEDVLCLRVVSIFKHGARIFGSLRLDA